jgi:aspartate/methionine/tyrosine aminotransferase
MVNVQAPTISQWAAVAALDGPQTCVEEMLAIYDERRKLLMPALGEMGFSFGEPRGGLYIWLNISSTGVDSTTLSYRLLQEADVLILPGTGFGDRWHDYMRMTILQPKEVLAEVIERMQAVLARGVVS